MCFEKAVKARPKARDKGNLFYMRIKTMNNLPLQPLVWIEANHPNGVYFEKTNSYIKAAICFCSTLVTDYVIRHDNDTGMYVVNYGGRTENEYHTLEEAKEWCESTHYPSKMQPYVKPDSITDIRNWFKAAKPEPTDKNKTTQLGCVVEEFAELMESVGLDGTARELQGIADELKGFTPKYAAKFIERINKIDALDATSDITVTVQGFNQLMGFDGLGAQREVIRSNNSKMVDGKFEFDANGKIMKPDSYSEPDLTPFISTMQNLHKGE